MVTEEADVETDQAAGRRKPRFAYFLIPLVLLALLALTWILAEVLSPPGAGSQTDSLARTQPASPAVVTNTNQITVAILAPLSGMASGFGAATRDGALLAINEWNARGGVLGMKIRPAIRDGQCNPASAAKAARAVIDEDRAHYIVGEVCSGASTAISDIAGAAHAVQITPVSTEPGVTVDQTGAAKPYVFRACLIDPEQGAAAARFAYEELKARTAVVVTNQEDSYSKGLSAVFSQAFTGSGGRVIAQESYTGKDTSFAPVLARVAPMKPDVVYLADFYKAANLFTKQAKEQGLTAAVLGSDGWDSPDLDLPAAAGNYFTTHWAPEDPRPEVQTFVRAYSAAYPGEQPNSLSALGYDAMNLMLEAIKAAGVDDAARVKDTLASINYSGVTGKITFDAQHNPRKPAVVMQITARGPVFRAQVSP